MSTKHPFVDLDAIARNLITLDLAHLNPEDATQYEHELSVLAALNEALETSATALKAADPSDFWQQIYPLLSEVAALVSSQIAPLLVLNAERSFEISDSPVPQPLAIATLSSAS